MSRNAPAPKRGAQQKGDSVPEEHDKTDVRQGRTTKYMRHVLWISMVLAVIGLAIAYSTIG